MDLSTTPPQTLTHLNQYRSLKIILITGEESGDILGAELMQSLKREHPGLIVFKGVGGERMQSEGLISLFPMTDLSIIGFWGVIKNLPRLLGHIRRATTLILTEKPDIVVMIDNPAFTHAVARRVRKALPTLPMIDYVPPIIWAWGRWRIHSIRRNFDRLLTIFPFESHFYHKLGVECLYVGHPKLQLLKQEASSQKTELAKKIFLILPGSRRCEVRMLMPIFKQAIEHLQDKLEDYTLILPTTPRVRSLVEEELKNWAVKPILCDHESEKFTLMKQASLALAASGTVTLELGLCGVPMVVAFRRHAWEIFLMRFIICKKDPMLAMPNIILGRRVVPECIQGACTPQHIARELDRLLTNVSYYNKVKQELQTLGPLMLESIHPTSIGQLVLEKIDS